MGIAPSRGRGRGWFAGAGCAGLVAQFPARGCAWLVARFPAPESAPIPAASRGRSRRLALGVIAAGTLIIILDGSIVTVATPAIQSDPGFTPTGLSRVVNAYLIAFGSLLLLAGRLGDLIGRKRMFLAGTAVFTAASLLAGFATGPGVLLAARFLQGADSAMAAAVGLGIIGTLFTRDAARRTHDRGGLARPFGTPRRPVRGAAGAARGRPLPVMLPVSGGGPVLPAPAGLGMSAAFEEDAGLASGLFNTTRQIGMALGVAVLAGVMAVAVVLAALCTLPAVPAASAVSSMVLAAVGMGLAAPSLTLLSLTHAPADRQGYASSAMQTSQNLGQTLVLALASALFSAATALSTGRLPAFAAAFVLLLLPVVWAWAASGRAREVPRTEREVHVADDERVG
uniref:MFS transporter n=1 Tax=Streptomyces kunmingensis TaxID=68225 RepID=UPI003983B915